MNVKLGRMFAGTVPVVGCAILAVVLAVFTASGAYAQDVFSSSANPATSGNSGKTGTQGVNGNPFCPPPVIIVNGVRTTPRNWSCRGDAQSYQTTPHAPPAVARPGPAYAPGSANPCQPSGSGGYNFLNNPVGTALPPGCVRPSRNGGGGSMTPRPVVYFDPLPWNVARPAPTPYAYTDPTPDDRKPPMPTGQISPGYDSPNQGYRKPAMPVGQISPGYDSANQGYRRPPMPVGQISPGYDSAYQSFYGLPQSR